MTPPTASEGMFTPGPWNVETLENSEDASYVSDENGAFAKHRINNSWGLTVAVAVSDCVDEAEANAQLIASAPQMHADLTRLRASHGKLVEALKRLEAAHSLLLSDRGCLDSQGMTEAEFEEVIHAGEIAREALARATAASGEGSSHERHA